MKESDNKKEESQAHLQSSCYLILFIYFRIDRANYEFSKVEDQNALDYYFDKGGYESP